ncbi:hypothetical protein ASF21_06550 [Arthrobacter sp. Leaf234]|uniref:DUF6807 family protein n=1 Tax=Arthrobacter sp. Leaf234 TaxID=1736303 RepID=UPI0006F87B5E|nr:DUF6807 family protein [Arthrobacter sp. Leaf234]KQO03877.1 hypothetical protein ASF21_06550 [Arthrobacter sp. Leaf234]
MSASVPLSVGGRRAGLLHDGTDEPAVHSPRPFVHPLLTPGGLTVSGDRPSDHPWHHGLGIAVSTVTVTGQAHPVNFWGGPTFLRGEGYVQLPNNGVQQVGSADSASTDGASTDSASTDGTDGRVRQQLVWRAADGTEVLAEERTWRVDTIGAGGVDWFRTTVSSRWTNTGGGGLAFGSPTTSGRPAAGYGGFFLRLAQTFDGATVLGAPDPSPARDPDRGAGGVGPPAPTAVELDEAEAMGRRGSWLGVRAATASVLMVAGRGAHGGPTPWFVRTTGTPMLCAAPFFHEEVPLAPAATVDWTWSVLVADGAVPGTAFAAAARVPLPAVGRVDPPGI